MVVDNTKCRHCSFAPLVFTLFEPHSYIKVTLAANFVLCACDGKVVDIADCESFLLARVWCRIYCTPMPVCILFILII